MYQYRLHFVFLALYYIFFSYYVGRLWFVFHKNKIFLIVITIAYIKQLAKQNEIIIFFIALT